LWAISSSCISPHLHDLPFTSLLGEQIAINVVVPISEKYRLPPAPALGHVVRKAGNHHAGKAVILATTTGKKRGIGTMSTTSRRQREIQDIVKEEGSLEPVV
jgi:hypothetical protein